MVPVLMSGMDMVVVTVVLGLMRLQEEVRLLLLLLLRMMLLQVHGLLHHVHLVLEV